MAGAGGRVQDWRPRDAPASTSRGSQRAPAGRGVRTPAAEVIHRLSDSHVTSVCKILTPALRLVPTVRRNLLVGVEVVEEVAIEDTVELM